MSWLGYAFFAVLAIAVFVGEILVFYRNGYERGFAAGRKATEEWIVQLESDVDQERQKIWKNEGAE